MVPVAPSAREFNRIEPALKKLTVNLGSKSIEKLIQLFSLTKQRTYMTGGFPEGMLEVMHTLTSKEQTIEACITDIVLKKFVDRPSKSGMVGGDCLNQQGIDFYDLVINFLQQKIQ
jgi:hypothetical protein